MGNSQPALLGADTPIIVSSGDATGTPSTLTVKSQSGFASGETGTKNLLVEQAGHLAVRLKVEAGSSTSFSWARDVSGAFWMVMLQPPGLVIWTHDGTKIRSQTAHQFTYMSDTKYQDSEPLPDTYTLTVCILGTEYLSRQLSPPFKLTVTYQEA
jgi:hypothetical protein